MGKSTRILVVEDEYITAKMIVKSLEASGYDIVGHAINVNEAVVFLEKEIVDCILLDINLNDDKDGIWIANHVLKNYNTPFIYLTAYNDNDTIKKAIQTNPYGFLSKPFQNTELFTAIEIALNKYNEIISTPQDRHLFFKNVDRFDKVKLSDINFIESQKNYLLIHTNTHVYKQRGTIKDFEQNLNEKDFMRVHRAFIINTNQVEGIDTNKTTIVVSRTKIPVSKAYKEQVDQLLKF